MMDDLTDDLTVLESAYSLAESKNEVREMIAELEKALSGLPQIEIPINEHFSKGVYAREMRVPKDSLIIGKIHKYQNLNILSAGEVTVFSIDGKTRVKAPFTFVASPGSKRVFYMHEDTVWTTVLGTDEKNYEEIEKSFIAKSYEEVEGLLENTTKLIKEMSCLS